MKHRPKKSRHTIGLLISRLEDSYQASVWPGVTDFAQEHDINLIFYVGKNPRSPYDYDYQYNVIYDFVNPAVVDGLVLLSGSLGNFLSTSELVKFAKRYDPIPMVSIAAELPGIPSILVDNYNGIKEMFRHLVLAHGYKRIAFVRGLKMHQESEIRFNAYCDSLEEYKIPYDPTLITQGGELVPANGADAVRILFDERSTHCDAIMCVNDAVAIGVVRELQKRGVRIPQDCAVVGFDDVGEASYITPPLTTIMQPLYDQAKVAMKMLIDIIDNNAKPDNVFLATKLIIRESCGCYPKSYMDFENQTFPIEIKAKVGDESTENTKKNIIEHLIGVLHIEDIRREKVALWLDRLFEALLVDLKGKDESVSFIHTIKDILGQQQMDQGGYNFWHEVLSFLRIVFLGQFKTYQKLNRIEWIFQRAQDALREFVMRMLYSKNTHIEEGVLLLSEVSQRLITSFEISELMNVIARELPRLGIGSGYISLYNRKKIFLESRKWHIPPRSELYLGFDRDNRVVLDSVEKRFPTKLLIPRDLFIKANRWTMILMPLFFRDEQLGFVLFDLGPTEEMIYETLRTQISSAIKGAFLFQSHLETEKELIKALADLDHTNKELQGISLRDELTGLYNRRAFLTLSEQHLRLTRRTKKTFLLFFADLDKLKFINDTYGHKEGDLMIVQTAEILRMTFRQADIIARFGGDEFTIIAIDASLEDIRILKTNLQNNVDRFNLNSKKPYQLHISMGVAIYDKNEDPSLDKLISIADHDLYEQKRKRK